MKVIALQGRGNSGKSTTLKSLILELAGDKGNNLLDVPNAHRYHTFIYKDNFERKKNREGDLFAKIKYNSKIIGICSAGDYDYIIKPKFDLLKDDIDYFVCASRDKGSSFDYIKALEKTYEVSRINKIGVKGDAQSCSDDCFIKKIKKELGIN